VHLETAAEEMGDRNLIKNKKSIDKVGDM